KKLVIEFKDELDALGVKVDQLDKRVAVIENRLGGWKLSGVLWQTFDYVNTGTGHEFATGDNPAQQSESFGRGSVSRARIYFDRWFGEDESIHFFARLNGGHSGASTTASTNFDRFWATTPAWFGTTLRVGRFWGGFIEQPYYLDSGPLEMLNFYSVINTRRLDMIALSKAFGLGEVTAYLARPTFSKFTAPLGAEGEVETFSDNVANAWELALMGKFQLNEQFGLDLGVNAILGDDGTTNTGAGKLDTANYKLDNIWTVYGGLRFEFTPSIGLRGMYYYQSPSGKYTDNSVTGPWNDSNLDSASAYTGIIDVKQDLLKFTSLWLQYQKFEKGFTLLTGLSDVVEGGITDWGASELSDIQFLANDWTIIRAIAQQQWNNKWKTYEFYSQHKLSDVDANGDGTVNSWGLGVEYRLNPSVVTGLGYYNYSYADAYDGRDSDSVIRWRTAVAF
ncbi:MAG: hypothetical protein LBR38_05260, partial [Synergistaceae bacterium]|nr:hypothetical protein [Synergistaceae bacterium]